MKKILLIALIFSASINGFSQDAGQHGEESNSSAVVTNVPNGWVKYKSEELAVTAIFPATPKESVQKVQTAVGSLDMHMVMYAPLMSGDDNAVYSLIRSDYPEEQFKDADQEKQSSILDGAVEGAVTNVNGTKLSDKKIKLNGYPGRSIKIQTESGYIYINAYLVENVMFITQVITMPSNDGNKSIRRFMDSFDILKVK
ncbi:hypothetical protein DFQ05_0872 [Winogradskyella wandonensis]|uniref:PsbP protein n=2 Tax=Winogradskyella TaxID=286104 RepID=A0A4V2PU74_9FLAO|nr:MULTISPECIES: hypothetical protein [Winogradskyella]TCK69351.1 hypothetical protein DFQ05_0872 [Winogradskyella wandonensis]SHH58756.1 hypothetical protein SAMN05444148_2384 [Winogradskyella jejuensis]